MQMRCGRWLAHTHQRTLTHAHKHPHPHMSKRKHTYIYIYRFTSPSHTHRHSLKDVLYLCKFLHFPFTPLSPFASSNSRDISPSLSHSILTTTTPLPSLSSLSLPHLPSLLGNPRGRPEMFPLQFTLTLSPLWHPPPLFCPLLADHTNLTAMWHC